MPGQGRLKRVLISTIEFPFQRLSGTLFFRVPAGVLRDKESWPVIWSAGSLIRADADRVPLVKSSVPADDNYQVNRRFWQLCDISLHSRAMLFQHVSVR